MILTVIQPAELIGQEIKVTLFQRAFVYCPQIAGKKTVNLAKDASFLRFQKDAASAAFHHSHDVRHGLRHVEVMENAVGENEIEVIVGEFHVLDATSLSVHLPANAVTPGQFGSHGHHLL